MSETVLKNSNIQIMYITLFILVCCYSLMTGTDKFFEYLYEYYFNKLTMMFIFITIDTDLVPIGGRVCSIFIGAGKFFLAYRIRMSACFTWTDSSYLTHIISPRTGYKSQIHA